MAKPQPSWALGVPGPDSPASPRTMRTLRKIQSHQVLSTSSALIAQTRTSRQARSPEADPESAATPGAATRVRAHRRARSNSDASREAAATPPVTQRRPARKTGSGIGLKRSFLENLLRDGPQSSNPHEGLRELKYLVLSSRVDADGDGMSPYRIYLWLALLDIPPMPTDDYLALIHRGRSPAYAKIRNDTFRTLATDPLFKRRVTEASLIRLLNAVAWKLHDSRPKPRSRQTSSRPREMELLFNAPASVEEESPFGGELETVSNSTTTDSTMYVQGMNVLCAPFLYAARSEVEAFALFHYFVTRECPGYIRNTMDGVHKGLRLVDRCLEIVEPKLAVYLFSKGMHAELPNKILRSFPPLDAKEIIALTVLLVRKIPEDLYAEMISHAK
ncbi:Mitotic check point protein (Bub2), putative [Penicillium digitatum PHI26]|uniref:Mitotic check point protein (Bub2), putative n=2 Tax=Penicillium digitatum TaxID=36651 RepID=K9GJY5_PEND2|nr:Mitotic check point protein (Bub2), putative [Penicillium digitatum Pd1]EKV05320.1 Mitotic check point protein (Bub2), putative [Penicillium digitatum Pd1]EKV13521.1 Mitotic check point protein (Bub2), putative [Penicillium digitatum PHI26]